MQFPEPTVDINDIKEKYHAIIAKEDFDAQILQREMNKKKDTNK